MPRGKFSKKMRSAYLMLAQVVCKISCPAIVDQHTSVDRNDAERLDGFLARLAMQELDECLGTVGDYVQPLGFLVDLEACLISNNGC